jgi:hypothetical protein
MIDRIPQSITTIDRHRHSRPSIQHKMLIYKMSITPLSLLHGFSRRQI